MTKNSSVLTQSKLIIADVPIDELNPAPYNPRIHDRKAMDQLKESIKRFGMVDPIIINNAPNRRNVVIGGHMRLKVLGELGHETVPAVQVCIPNVEREKELNLRLNKNTGEWNYDLLKEFDLNMLLDVGFGDAELSTIWDDTLETEDDGFETEKELARIHRTDIKPGDMFRLGEHVLLCGDSTNSADVQRLVGTNKIGFIIADPPYNIHLSYADGIGTKGKYGGTKTTDNKTDADYETFLRKTMENALAAALPDAHCSYWCDESYVWVVQKLFRELGLTNRRICFWVKNNASPTPQIAFSKATEPCVYATRGKPYLSPNLTNLNEILNKEVGAGGRAIEDVLDVINLWLVKRLPANQYAHPTQKDPTLYEKTIRRCTKVGDPVLELFGGSGSTLIACQQLKRRAFAMEIDPVFVQLIINRYEILSNDKAKKIN